MGLSQGAPISQSARASRSHGPLKTKPKLETHTSIDVARGYYLEQCQHPDIDLDAEQDIVIDALREIAGKRAMARQAVNNALKPGARP